jgi:hypothetical protein
VGQGTLVEFPGVVVDLGQGALVVAARWWVSRFPGFVVAVGRGALVVAARWWVSRANPYTAPGSKGPRNPHSTASGTPEPRPGPPRQWVPRSRSSTYALYAATCARLATRSTGRSASTRADISDALTAPPWPFSYATETSSPTR